MNRTSWALPGLLAIALAGCRGGLDPLEWQRLPTLPDALGFGGPFAGVSNEALIVAGGANFPESLFRGGKKVWDDKVFLLSHPSSNWRIVGKLDRPLAYGGAVSVRTGVILLGGCDAEKCTDDVVLLSWTGGTLKKRALAKLPKPCAFTSAVLIGRTIYVAGGQETVDATAAMKNFWALDLSQRPLKWKKLEPWPGPARVKAVTGTLQDSLYLFSGTELAAGSDGKPKARFLSDAYRYTPGRGWAKLPDLPRPAAAAPSPAPQYDRRFLLVLGGADGTNADKVFVLKDKHPGFRHDVLGFDTVTNTWVEMGEMPISRVTTMVAHWQGMIIVPTGEVRPGVRSPEVWAARLARY